MNKDDITYWLNKYNVTNYSVHQNGIVDVGDGGFDSVQPIYVTELPIQFGHVRSFKTGSMVKLGSIKGFPHTVDRICNMNINSLKSLSGIDKVIKRIGKAIVIPPHATHLLGVLLIADLHIVASAGAEPELLRIINKHLKAKDILACQDELIDAGFVDQARL